MNRVPQYDYVLELVERFAPHAHATVLDYGCGGGEIVQRALAAGLDAHGVDVFYEGGALRDRAADTGLLGSRILELEGARIPRLDASVDVVVANMVFEHIEAFEPALAEIARVLRPGGVFVNLFPSRSVWREGHVGLPFVHRFARAEFGARLRYAVALGRLGFGYNRAGKPIESWAREALDWIDRWTHYKPLAEIERSFARHFAVARIDEDFLPGRLRHHPRLRPLSVLAGLAVPAFVRGFLARRLATHVFVLRKPGVAAGASAFHISCHAQNVSTFHTR